MTCNASSNNPGFSYFVGVNDKDINKFRNFCDCASVGGAGILGRFRNEAYEGGVSPWCEPLDVEGLYPGDWGGLEGGAEPRRFDDEGRS